VAFRTREEEIISSWGAARLFRVCAIWAGWGGTRFKGGLRGEGALAKKPAERGGGMGVFQNPGAAAKNSKV